MFFAFYGIVFGLFIGYGYFAPVKNCYEQIPDKKGNLLNLLRYFNQFIKDYAREFV